MNSLSISTSIGSISIKQNRSDGFPVVFIHGNSLSSSTFINQLNDQNLNRFRLIAFDLPGHGNSFRSSNPEVDYSLNTFIKILLETCNQLNAGNGILVGHSLGGHIAINSLAFLTEIKGLMVFGTTPLTIPPKLDKAFLPNPLIKLIFKSELTKDEILQMTLGFVGAGNNIPNEIKESIQKSDPLVRIHIGKALNSGDLIDEVNVISDKHLPFAILHGKGDQLVNGNYFNIIPKNLLWGNTVNMIENAGHSPQLENPFVFNNILNRFIDSIFQS